MKKLCIDLRWTDASGIGTYVRGIMPGLVSLLGDISIVGLGDRSRLEEFEWSRAANMRLIECRASRYSLTEQIQLPLAIPSGTDLFFSPYYPIPLLYRGRLAVTVHDLSHRVVPEIIGDPQKRIYAQTMFHELRKRASIIFARSNFLKSDLLRLTSGPRRQGSIIFPVSNFSKSELLRLTSGPRDNNIILTPLGISEEWYGAAQLPVVRSRPYIVF